MKPGGKPRILVVRPDRIGDVILSTPVVAELHRQLPNVEIWMCVRSEIAGLLVSGNSVDSLRIPGLTGVVPYEPDGRHRGMAGVRVLASEFRAGGFATAIILQDTIAVSAAVWAAGIPVRVGPRSRVWSYLFFNRAIRQRRSSGRFHEAEYNLELLTALGIQPAVTRGTSSVVVSSEGRKGAEAWRKTVGIETRNYVLLHPGMRGSAPNLPVDFYKAVAGELVKREIPVLFTFGPLEEELKKDFSGLGPCYGGTTALGLPVMAALCEGASVVVAPSTGPLHLAVALGRPVVTAYPPAEGSYQVQSADRWGPWAIADQATVFVAPQVENGMLSGIEIVKFVNSVVKTYESSKNR